MRVVSESDAIQALPTLLRETDRHPVVVRDGEQELGAIVSMKDYELIRKANVERLFRAMDELGAELRAGAAEQGISIEELEQMLDRKAK